MIYSKRIKWRTRCLSRSRYWSRSGSWSWSWSRSRSRSLSGSGSRSLSGFRSWSGKGSL